MPATRQTPAYILEAARQLAAQAPEFDEQTLAVAFTALGATAPAPRGRRIRADRAA